MPWPMEWPMECARAMRVECAYHLVRFDGARGGESMLTREGITDLIRTIMTDLTCWGVGCASP